jgi:hypothetical protein
MNKIEDLAPHSMMHRVLMACGSRAYREKSRPTRQGADGDKRGK